MKKTLILVFFLNFSCSPDFSEISFSDITFIENSLKVIRIIGGTKEDVVKMFPLVTDYIGNFRWKGSPGSIDYAKMIWQEAFK